MGEFCYNLLVYAIATSPNSYNCAYPILEKPSAPRDLAATDVSQSSAVLKWSLPESDGGSAITNYVVEKCNTFNGRWVRACKATITDTTVSLTDLVEGTSYEFRVAAENDAGVGPSCEPIGPVEAKEPKGMFTCSFV